MADGYISKIKLPDNKEYEFRDKNLKVYTGTCTTSAATAIKQATTDGAFTLVKGAVVFVNFSNTNSAAVDSLKLQVNNTEDKPIKYLNNDAAPADIPDEGYLRENQTYMFRYDGTNWVVDLQYNTNSHYTTHLYVTSSEGTATTTAALSNGNVYLKLFDNTTKRESYKIQGTTGIGVTSDADGNLAIQHTHTDIDAKSTFVDTATTASANGGKIKVTDIKYDAQGHITGSQDRTITLSQKTNFDDTYLKLNGSNNMTADVNIIAGDTDKFVNFWYNVNKTAGASWRVGMLGSGSNNTNYFVIQSGTSTTSATAWKNALKIGQNNYDIYNNENRIPNTGNATGSVGGTTTPVYVDAGVIKAGNVLKALAYKDSLEASDIPDISGTYLPLSGGTMTGNINLETNSSGDTNIDGTIILANSGTKIIQKMRNTSNWGMALAWDNTTTIGTTYLPGIGWHNQKASADASAENKGGITIIPYGTNTSPWGKSVGLFISKTDLKWEGKNIAYFTTATSSTTNGQILISDSTADGGIKNSGYTIKTSVPANAVFTDTNKYHTTGSWGGTNNLTYTATAVNSADALAFTLATASTSAYGVTKLSSATDSDSEVLAATPKAIKTLNTKMDGLLAAANAMTFKGTIDSTNGSDADGSTNRKTLPATHNAGDTYRVAKEGTYAGKYCEIGTLIICVKDGTAAVDADWTSVETNEDGSVIGATPTDSTDNALAVWDGTSGRIIKSQSYVTYLNHAEVKRPDENTVIAHQDGLIIKGNSYGNAGQVLEDQAGIIKYGDGGPQIQFITAQPAAIIYSHHDNTSGMQSAFHFVGEQTVAVKADALIAKTRAIFGAQKVNDDYILYSNGATYINGNATMTGILNLAPGGSGEGGEIHLHAAEQATTKAGIVIDNYNSNMRIFGIQSADGSTKTGVGTPLIIDPYAKTITGGYTLTGALTGHASSDLALSGGKMTGRIYREGKSTNWNKGRDNALVATSTLSGYSPFASIKTTSGSWDIGAYNSSNYTDDLIFSYVTDTQYSGSPAVTTAQIKFLEDGHIVAELDGNATSATSAGKWTTARTLTIGNKDQSVDGSKNVNWSLADIGAAPADHTHGNLTNDGKITSTTTIGNGDRLVIVDSDTTAASKITGSSITFNGSTKTKALTQAGTWETFNNYSHPTTSGNKHIPSGGSSGQFLGWSADGTATWVDNPDTDTHYTTKLIAGDSSATSNKAVSSGNIYLRIFDDNEPRDPIQIKPGDNMTITSDASGIITFKATDTKNTAYGNISTSGTMSSTGVALANGDQLLFSDSSASGKIERTSITFDASTETECLTKKGTWKAFNNYSLPTAKYDTLGGVKPWYSHTKASTGPSAGSNATAVAVNAIQTEPGRYYAIESDSNGRLFVNVPWTDTNNAATHTVKTTTQYYITGTETITTSTGGDTFDPGIYATTTAGQLNATSYKVNEKVTLQWNSTDSSLDFIFA